MRSARRSSRRPPRSGWPRSTSPTRPPRRRSPSSSTTSRSSCWRAGCAWRTSTSICRPVPGPPRGAPRPGPGDRPRRRRPDAEAVTTSRGTPHMPDMLRIAVPNKGQLSGPASEMLREAGYRQRKDSRDLVLVDPDNETEFFFLRPKDIAVYVGEGILQAGITGRDMLLDSGAPVEEVLPLGFGGSTFRFAARGGASMKVEDLNGKRIATSFEGLLERYLEEKGVQARVIHLDGAVESAIQLGVADAVADVVSTGTTLRNAGLELFGDPILTSEAVVIRPQGAGEDADVDRLLRRLRGVLVARDYVMMDYDVHAEKLDTAVALTPGMEGPTVSPLHREGWVAVRAMVPRRSAQQIMDDLWQLGARAILVTDIYACRL